MNVIGASIEDVIPAGGITGLDVTLAILTLIATWVAFRLTRKGVRASVDRIGGMSENVRSSIVRVSKYLVMLLGIGVALNFLGAQLAPVLTVALIVVGVLALALRGVAENFGSSIIIQSRKSVALGEEIALDDHIGVVSSMNARAVIITTSDGRQVHLPNSDFLKTPLINHSRQGVRRSEVQVRCAAADDPQAAMDRLIAAAAGAGGVRGNPPPDARAVTVEAERITLRIRYWHEPLSRTRTTSNVVMALASDLRRRNIPGTVTSAEPMVPFTPPPPM